MTEQRRITDTGRTDKHLRTRAIPPEARFWEKVAKTPTCWEWTGARNSRGYGALGVNSKPWLAHRYSYTLAYGAIGDGLTLDHLCRNIICVRPEHLQAVSTRTNVLRGIGPSAVNALREFCIHGHALTPDNVRQRTDKRGRRCVTCERIRNREWQRAHYTPTGPATSRATNAAGADTPATSTD